MNLLLIDIDHTLSDACWRDDMRDEAFRSKNWDTYHRKSAEDKPCLEMAELIASLRSVGWYVVGLTTRPEKWRTLTNCWLLKHEIFFDDLLMRPNADFLPGKESKLRLFKEFIRDSDEWKHVIAIDNHEEICAAFRAANVTVLQAHIRRCG